MKHILYIFLLASLISCDDETNLSQCFALGCSEEAVVKDLTGLDGCGFVFELTDGTRLEPQMLAYCGTPPLPKEVTESPLYNFQFIDGKRVKIGFEEIRNTVGICMAGKIVKITCLEELISASE